MPAADRVVWSPAAAQDLLDIWGYYARVASADIADNILRDIERVVAAIRENPLLSRDRGELLSSLRSATARPHVIFFLVRSGDVLIARVLHGRRDFPAMFDRDEG